MRILAIRGNNIASLCEPFEIDLAAEPFAGTGLFAITGDTGAGKSTILDALCLALYGDYPRASTATREKVADPSGQQLEVSDARNILRRGAGQGYAEVDFVGQDGVGYRARWSVRRARGRADGNPQKPERVLERLDGEGAVASSLRDVEAAIVARSGFTFDQFRRSVLLAQGEFDAFLLASEPERAGLLEKITGTGIYSAISQQVFDMTAARQGEVAELERQHEAIGLLGEDARAALAAEREGVAHAAATGEARHVLLAAQVARAEAIAAARAGVTEAEDALASALSAWEAAAGERALAARLAAIAPHAALASGRRELEREGAAARAACKAAAEAFAAASATVETARESVARNEQAAGLAAENIARSEPLWQRAAEFDALVVAAGSEAAKATEDAAKARSAALGLEQEHARAAAALADMERRLQDTRDALAVRAGQAALAQDIGRVGRLLDQHGELVKRADGERQRWRQASTEATAVAQRLAKAQSDVEAHDRDRQVLDDELEATGAELMTLDETGLAARYEAIGLLREAAQDACDAARRRDAAVTGVAGARAARRDAEQALTNARGRLAEASASQQRLTAERAEAGRMADLAEATLSKHAARLRATLVDGEACPVCGAEAHPFAHDDSAGAEIAKSVRTRLAGLDQDLATANAAILSARGDIATAEARIASAAAGEAASRDDEAAACAALANLMPSLRERDAALRGDELPDLGGDEPELSALIALAGALDALRAALVQPRRRAAELRRARDEAQRRRDAIAKTMAGIERLAAADRDQVARAEGDMAAIESVGRELAERILRSREELVPYVVAAGLDADDLDRDPARVKDVMQGLAKDHADLGAAEAALSGEHQRLAARVASAEAMKAAAADTARVANRLADERASELRGLTTERAAMLGGMATAAHRARLREAEAAARRALDAARVRLSETEAARSRCNVDYDLATDRSERIERELRDNAVEWASALAGLGFDDAAAVDLLATPADDREALMRRLKAVDEALLRAETALATRRADFDARIRDGGDIEHVRLVEIREEMQLARAAIDAAKARQAVIGSELERDADARRKADAVARSIELKRAEAAVWQEVNDAIGQKSGDKFRRFAQGVTLGQLVALANVQLAALNPRYRLRTGAVSDLAFDVEDRDMGDELRSPRSLSGGERFLVSLALALALSGLEGRQSFVDTLFIDEGFGSLDRDTLDIAIDALEALQGHGRKVGVITHVPAMIERIATQVRVEKRGGGRSVVRVDDKTSQPTAMAG